MKLLFLCKRFPQGRDLLTRPYGRFYHLARLLAARGHSVRIALLSYRGLPSAQTSFDGIGWTSDDLLPRGPMRYWRRLGRLADTERPDWVIGESDTYFGIAAKLLASRSEARCAIDAYDNFESYLPWALPLHWLWRSALASADLVTAAGPQLAERLIDSRGKRVEVLPMAADPQFVSLDRYTSRARLGLPTDRRLIGHLGAFDRSRGHQVVLDAFNQVRAQCPDVSLVLSGRHSLAFHRPPEVLGIGYIADDLMPALVNSLDVACVALVDNAFGRFSYPVKLCEAMACGVPVVASATAPVRWMAENNERILVETGSASAMAEGMLANLAAGRMNFGAAASWDTLALRFEALLDAA